MKLIPRILPGLLLPLALALPSITQAATFSVIPLDENGKLQAPEGNLVVDFLETGVGPNQGTDEYDVKQNRDNAQTFTATSSFTLDKIAINFESAAFTFDRQVTFEFFTVSDPASKALSAGPVIDSVTFFSSDLGIAAGTLLFDVTDMAVSAGSHFGIRFDTDASTDLVFKWNFSPQENYFRYQANTRVDNDSDGYYTVGVIAAIPEPSTYAMIFGALALVGAVVRRRLKR